MEGMAMTSMECLEERLDSQIRSICQGLPSCLKYVGYERCTPDEEFEEITRLRSNRRMFDLAESSVYMIKCFFIFTDPLGKEHEITRFLYLPFVDQAGIISISGSKHHIIPVLYDKVFTPGLDSIFVRLAQDRNNMFRMYNTVVVDGKRETRYVAWAVIYRSPEARKSKSTVKRTRTLLTHYLFGKYGFTGAFERYAKAIPEYGYEDQITPENYPPSEWMIFQSTKRAPDTYQGRHYQPNLIRLAVRRSEYTPEMEALIFGFFYVTDHYPDRFMPRRLNKEVVDSDGVVHVSDALKSSAEMKAELGRFINDTSLWIILIGVIVLGDLQGEHILHREISEHFEFLDACLDDVARMKLAEKNIYLENYYDMLCYLAVHFNEMIQESNVAGLNVYGKNLEIVSCILYDIIYGFTSMKFSLNKAANRRPLSLKDVTSNLQQFVKMGEIFKIHTGKIITKSVSYSGDHMYPGITAVIAEQEDRAGATRGQTSRVVVGPQQRIDLSMITIGSVLNLPKSNPTPLARINPWANVDDATGTVLPSPKLEPLIAKNRPYFKF